MSQNVIDWQLDSGGWPKNVPMHDRLSPKERKAVLARMYKAREWGMGNGEWGTGKRWQG